MGSLGNIGLGLLNPTTLLGTGLAVGGDLLNYYGNQEEAERNRQAQAEINERNYQMQKEFAQMGITWRIEDAKRAGIHPLAALGASSAGASPSFQMGDTEPSKYKLGANLANTMGQNIGRAMNVAQNQEQKLETQLRLENMRLQNDRLWFDIYGPKENGPPMPVGGSDSFVPGQSDSGVMLVRPSERTSHQRGRPSQEAGARPDVAYSRTDTGLVPVIPQGLSESMEDDMIGKILWRIRNQALPNFSLGGRPPKSQLPQGSEGWRWDTFKQEWQPHTTRGKSLGRDIKNWFRYRR